MEFEVCTLRSLSTKSPGETCGSVNVSWSAEAAALSFSLSHKLPSLSSFFLSLPSLAVSHIRGCVGAF